MRLRNDPNAQDIIQKSKYAIDINNFNLNKDIIIEIGMGKGEMLTQMAFANPHKIYLGIEKYPTVVAKAIKRAEKLELNNFFIVNDDLINLKESFKGQVDEIWLTFSDPWPKKRHYKRRLTYKTFLDIYKTILSPNGVLKIKTDNDQFFNWSIESITQYGAKVIYQTIDLHNDIKNQENIYTGYETKWSAKNKNINYMEVVFI